MSRKNCPYLPSWLVLLMVFLAACKNTHRPPQRDIASSPEQLRIKASDYIRKAIDYAAENRGDIGDSTMIRYDSLLRIYYEKGGYNPVWSNKEHWRPKGESLLKFIGSARLYGLFPEDYHYPALQAIQDRFQKDSASSGDRRDAALWSKADLMLTDAFIQIVHDVRLGRLNRDSVTLRADSVLKGDFYLRKLDTLDHGVSLAQVIDSLEPRHPGYRQLKAGVRLFLDSARFLPVTQVPMPGKDPVAFKKALQTRLYEEGLLETDSLQVDSLTLANAVKKFQRRVGINVDGVVGAGTVRMLNLSDEDKFLQIAITMDRYKMLPEKMPQRYILVNLPAYSMQLRDSDSVRIYSKIICGKPATRTPLLTSSIGEIITYPQWTMPTSIIVKEVLPAARKNPGYFAKKGYSLIDKDGNEVDPFTVDWTKYHKGIPYKVVQGSGDDNALGVLKFNFNNKYAVYLHDTNQRYLFAQTTRALSHGCVRVQEWQQLAYDLIRYDNPDTSKTSPKEDSLNCWLKNKSKHSIYLRNKVPLFIRYFTCEGNDRGVVFYDDMYGDDRVLRQKYFPGK